MQSFVSKTPAPTRPTSSGNALRRGFPVVSIASAPLEGPEDLSLAYTPGVARVCEAIAEDFRVPGNFISLANTLFLGRIGSQQSLTVSHGNLIVIGMDLVKGKETMAVTTIIHERGL